MSLKNIIILLRLTQKSNKIFVLLYLLVMYLINDTSIKKKVLNKRKYIIKCLWIKTDSVCVCWYIFKLLMASGLYIDLLIYLKCVFFFQPPADIEEEWGIIFKDKML